MGANAQTSVPAFTAGQVLTAAQVTGINTGIPVFASSTERDAAFGGTGEKTLAEGQMAYLEDTNATQYYDGSSWAAVAGGKILQVVSTAKTDTYSASIAAGAFDSGNVTGLDASITPTSATSKVLIIAQIQGSYSGGRGVAAGAIYRGGTAIGVGDAASNRSQITGESWGGSSTDTQASATVVFLDSPATTSATTYGWRIWNTNSITRTYYINRSSDDTDLAYFGRSISTMTLLEVSA